MKVHFKTKFPIVTLNDYAREKVQEVSIEKSTELLIPFKMLYGKEISESEYRK